jgi:hypothetical protein
MGLELMKYRASLLSGALEIRPLDERARRGTIVYCTFPEAVLHST